MKWENQGPLEGSTENDTGSKNLIWYCNGSCGQGASLPGLRHLERSLRWCPHLLFSQVHFYRKHTVTWRSHWNSPEYNGKASRAFFLLPASDKGLDCDRFWRSRYLRPAVLPRLSPWTLPSARCIFLATAPPLCRRKDGRRLKTICIIFLYKIIGVCRESSIQPPA